MGQQEVGAVFHSERERRRGDHLTEGERKGRGREEVTMWHVREA